MFMRSVVSRVGAVVEQAAVRVSSQSQRLFHSKPLGALGSAGSSKGLLKVTSMRPLGSLMQVHDTKAKGDDELVSFLSEEIATEKKNQRTGPLPTDLEGFNLQFNQSEVTLSKKFNNEQISIVFNVNHTVDAEYGEEGGEPKAAEKDAEMRARPNFEIEIKKAGKVLNFNCSFVQDAAATADPSQDEYQDAFVIDEISIVEGEWNEETYAVAGDILDGYLYDLFMNMLEERGVTNEFVEKMSDVATDYEHRLYINLLGQLQNFLSTK